MRRHDKERPCASNQHRAILVPERRVMQAHENSKSGMADHRMDLEPPLRTRSGRIATTFTALAMLVATAGLGCASTPRVDAPTVRSGATTTAVDQQALTPNAALTRLQEGNQRFRSDAMIPRDYRAQVKGTATDQHPFASVLTCIDSRTTPEFLFDQGIGDLFVPRVAGNLVDPEVLGGLEFASKVKGSRLIVVLGHTHCGAIKGACDNVELGNLTSVIAELTPAVNATTNVSGERSSHNEAFVHAVTETNVRLGVAEIRERSPILAELEAAGKVKVVGAMYDIETGAVTFMD